MEELNKKSANSMAQKFLDNKFNGHGYECKIYDWTNNIVSNYHLPKLLEEYASQKEVQCKTNSEKIHEVLDKYLLEDIYLYYEGGMYPHRVSKKEIVDLITNDIINYKL